jgi:hypothetical protein
MMHLSAHLKSAITNCNIVQSHIGTLKSLLSIFQLLSYVELCVNLHEENL